MIRYHPVEKTGKPLNKPLLEADTSFGRISVIPSEEGLSFYSPKDEQHIKIEWGDLLIFCINAGLFSTQQVTH